MRSKTRFSRTDKPKVTHEDRRIQRATSYCWDGWEKMNATQRNDRTKLAAHELAEQDAREYWKNHKLPSWMKRADYLAVFDAECRRGKWRARAERGKLKRAQRKKAKRFGSYRYLVKTGTIELHAPMEPLPTWLAPFGMAFHEAINKSRPTLTNAAVRSSIDAQTDNYIRGLPLWDTSLLVPHGSMEPLPHDSSKYPHTWLAPLGIAIQEARRKT